jgi:hypothetical protein
MVMVPEFYAAVKALKQLNARHQVMALFAAQNWDEVRVSAEFAEAAGDPGDTPPAKDLH